MPRTVRSAVEMLLITLGVVAGVVFQFSGTAHAAPTAPQPLTPAQAVAHEQIRVLDVVPQPGVPYVLECRAETGPTDGAFRWKVCVPDESPDGGPVEFDTITENGEANYADGWHIIGTGETTPQGAIVNADRTVTFDTIAGQWDEPAAVPAPPMQTVAYVSGGSCSEPLPAPSGGTPTTTPQPRPLVNLNTATVAELDALPGVGPVTIDKIVKARPLKSVNDLRALPRIPTGIYPLVTV